LGSTIASLLQRAESAFEQAAYDQALFHLSIASKKAPEDEGVEILVQLSALALEFAEEARAVYEFYQIARAVDGIHASSMARTLIESSENYEVYGSAAELAERFRQRSDESSAISYDEFRQLVDENDDFQEIFEKVIYSTRVVVADKGEFFAFIEELIDNGYTEMALAYIDSANTVFPSDLRLRQLLDKIARQESLEAPDKK
jgi:hypothetical protein